MKGPISTCNLLIRACHKTVDKLTPHHLTAWGPGGRSPSQIPKFAWPPAKGVLNPKQQSHILVTVLFGYWTQGFEMSVFDVRNLRCRNLRCRCLMYALIALMAECCTVRARYEYKMMMMMMMMATTLMCEVCNCATGSGKGARDPICIQESPWDSHGPPCVPMGHQAFPLIPMRCG